MALFAMLFCIAFAQAQDCTSVLTGRVEDVLHQPVIGATILLLPGQAGQATDAYGNFNFEKLCPGVYTVRAQSLGYHTVEFQLTVHGTTSHIIVLQEETTELSEVVVQHHAPSHTENSNNYVQLNEKKLAESAGKTLGAALKELPGVSTLQTGPGIFKPVIHGVHSQRVLILIHGIRQEGQQWGAEHAPEIDPFIASNVVVIKDASAIKYGSGALGGVIIVNPPDLPEQSGLGGTFNSIFQSNGRSVTLSGMLEGGFGKHDGWGWRVQGTGKRAGDSHTPDYNLSNTGVREANFSAATGYHSERAGFDVFFSRFQTTIGILQATAIGSVDDLSNAMERDRPEPTHPFTYSIDAPRQEVSHNLAKINGHITTDAGEWKLQYGFQNNNRQEYNKRIGVLTEKPTLDLKLNSHTLDAEWESTNSEKRVWSLGLNGMVQDNKNVYGTQRIPFIPDFLTLSGGVFAVRKYYFKNLLLDFGVRYDYRYFSVKGFDYKNSLYHEIFSFHNVSATAGATVKLNAGEQLNFNLSTAGRPPHVSELFSMGRHQSAAANEYGLLLDKETNEVTSIDHSDFKQEQALKFVTTYQREISRVTFSATGYVNYIFNYIYLRPVGITNGIAGPAPALRYTQTDALFIGSDISANVAITRQLALEPMLTFLRASDASHHDYLTYIPANRMGMTLRYSQPQLKGLKNFYAESKTVYTFRQYRAPRVITPAEYNEAIENGEDPLGNNNAAFDFMAAPDGYWLWNLAVGVSIPGKHVQYDFRLSSENTLNQRYREYTNRFRYYADELGRNISFSFKCIF